MNHINGQIAVGAPRSLARYKEAHTVCCDCLECAPSSVNYSVLSLGNSLVFKGTCYVCENWGLIVARVEYRAQNGGF